MKKHDRKLHSIANHSLETILNEDEQQYLTLHRYGCDCGTVLNNELSDLNPEDLAIKAKRLATDKAKLKRKGWTKAKIDRWLSDREKANARSNNPLNGPDNIPMWQKVIEELFDHYKIEKFGIFLHFYSGDIDDENLSPTQLSAHYSEADNILSNFPSDTIVSLTSH